MKYLTYLFMLVILLSSASATCHNQDNSPFCSKDDPFCMVENEADQDKDGWSNSCDAFPENKYLWVDYDGDNIGYGSQVYDCDDIDANIQTYCGDTNLLNSDSTDTDQDTDSDNQENLDNEDTQEDSQDQENNDEGNSDDKNSEENNDEDSQDSSNSGTVSLQVSGGSSRNIIFVSDPKDYLVRKTTAVTENAEEETVGVYPKSEIIPLVDPEPVNEPDTRNQITGAVLGTQENPIWWPFVLLMAVIFFMFIIARRKKD